MTESMSPFKSGDKIRMLCRVEQRRSPLLHVSKGQIGIILDACLPLHLVDFGTCATGGAGIYPIAPCDMEIVSEGEWDENLAWRSGLFEVRNAP